MGYCPSLAYVWLVSDRTALETNTAYCHRPNSYILDKFECKYGEDCINHKVEDILKALNGK